MTTSARAFRLMLSSGALVALLGSGCGPSAAPPPRTAPRMVGSPATQPAARSGRILLDCQPADAVVVVDGTQRGAVSEVARRGGLTLPLGLHRIEITRDGFRPYRLELSLGEKTETIQVQLTPNEAKP